MADSRVEPMVEAGGLEKAAHRWRRLSEVFAATVEVPESRRESFLQQQCQDDADLHRRVSRLLRADARAERFLEDPSFAVRWKAPLPAPMDFPVELGAYRLLKALGSGGMGSVFLAERTDGTFERQVALKILHGSALGQDGERRFHREGRILARLEHPNIARLYDAGSAADGRPYLVMERVDGLPIDQHCERNGLSVEARVRLVLQVCDAVRFAHSHLLVHRDLKPSNVLVTAEGVPKLLDFGIAKLDNDAGSALTATGLLPLTPAYASPEQIRGEAVTTASDVFSLGVLLYELLAGRRPHGEGESFGQENQDNRYAVARAVCEDEPPPVSKAAARNDANGRRVELCRALRGDLDAILARALSKEPVNRYSSVEELAVDLGSYLEGRPVAARRGGWRYRAMKQVRRHRWGFGAAAVVLLLIAAATAAVWFQARQAARERDKLAGALQFLSGVFAETDPSGTGRHSMTAAEILRAAAEELPRALADEREVYAAVATTLGEVFLSYGLHQEAEPLLSQAVAIHRQSAGSHRGDLGASLSLLAQQRYAAGDYTAAETLIRESLELSRRALGGPRTDTAMAQAFLARVLYRQSRLDEAEELSAEAVDALRRSVGESDPRLVETMGAHAQLLRTLDRIEEAEALLRDVLELQQAASGGISLQVATTLTDLGQLRFDRGDPVQAETLFRQALKIWEEIVGEDHPDSTATSVNLANALTVQGKTAAAEAQLRRVLALRRAHYSPGHQRLLVPSGSLAVLLLGQGRLDEAAEILTEVLESAEQAQGAHHILVGNASCNLGEVRLRQAAFDEAEALFARCTEIYEAIYTDRHRAFSRPLLGLGRVRLLQDRPSEAEPLLRRALQIRQQTLPPGHPRIAEAEAALHGLKPLKYNG